MAHHQHSLLEGNKYINTGKWRVQNGKYLCYCYLACCSSWIQEAALSHFIIS